MIILFYSIITLLVMLFIVPAINYVLELHNMITQISQHDQHIEETLENEISILEQILFDNTIK